MGKLYGIGVGPGDNELLTIKGYKALRNAAAIFTPRGKDGGAGIAYSIVSEYIPETTPVIILDFPMIDLNENREDLEVIWNKNADLVSRTLERGDVAFLTLGDPFIFSTYSYILDFLRSKEVEVETIPGISAFSGLASRLGVPLTQGEDSLAVVSMTKDEKALRKIIKNHDSIVIMKVSAHPELIKTILQDEGLEDHFILASNVSTDRERITTDLRSLDDKLPYMTTMIINKKRVFNE